MNKLTRDHILMIFISLVIASVMWKLAAMLPHAVSFQGVQIGDIGVPYLSLRNWLNGDTVYNIQAVSTGQPFNVAANPFTTSLVLFPFYLLPLKWLAPLFCAFSAGLLSYGILRKGEPWRLLIFLSGSYFYAVYSVQWSPIFAAALYLPALLPIAIAKPQLGVALAVAGDWSKWTIITTFGLIILSFVLYPGWLFDFITRGNIQEYKSWIPVMTGIGVLLLLASLRWRSRKGRLLLAMSVVPQRLWYDQLFIQFIPQNACEQVMLTVSSWIPIVISEMYGWTINAHQDFRAAVLVVLFTYFPALVIVLRDEYQKEPAILVTWIDRLVNRVKGILPGRI